MAYIYIDRRGSTASSASSSCSVSPPLPTSTPLTLAELYKDLWSPEFAATYIYSYNVTSPYHLSPAELPSFQNRYSVSNYTVEKIALILQKDPASTVLEDVTRLVPSEEKRSFVTKLLNRVGKLLEKRRRLPLCGFCRNNGKPQHIYMSHTTKDVFGNVSCPTLKNYQCPKCGASGEDAHTVSYCPLN